jgi:hypothetical protein
MADTPVIQRYTANHFCLTGSIDYRPESCCRGSGPLSGRREPDLLGRLRYSLNCREGVFSETELPRVRLLGLVNEGDFVKVRLELLGYPCYPLHMHIGL